MAAPGVVTISNLCNKSVYTEKAVEGRGSVCRLQRRQDQSGSNLIA